ncbi:MAG TPA: threonine synthase, partial [Syntrophomonadaceae bacterium]|nr:threonine synthase [Syntrophomonadaceae bacterium]
MRYLSTRGDERLVSSARAITSGIAPDGGLYVPEQIPVINEEDWASLLTMSYQEQALYILGKYLSDFSIDQCQHCVQGAYHTGNFDHADIAPLFNIRDHIYSLELWHGPTCAFKDMALQILPYLMTTSAAIIGESNDIVILVATSGDTGKAALEGFQNVDGTHIIVFFPEEGVSEVQKRQMVTQQGN